MEERVDTVAIGGINASNVQRVLYQSKALSKGLDGVAIVSAIISAADPGAAAARLRALVAEPPAFATAAQDTQVRSVQDLLARVPVIVTKVVHEKPLCHNMTNLVVQNLAANVAHAM